MTDVVLVSGPELAGVTSMAAELRRRIPGRSFVEAHELAAGEAQAAVVYVVSAVAPMTESDCALADLVTSQTDAVVAVVSKVDDHREWRGVLAVNRERLAEFSARFQHVPWACAAAAPRLGEPLMDDLVELLDRQFNDPETVRRNRSRADEFRLRAEISRLDAEAAGADQKTRVDALRDRREELLRQRLLLGPAAATELRSRIQQARVVLTYSARNRCATARAELLEKVAGTSRRPPGGVGLGGVGLGRFGLGRFGLGGVETGAVDQVVRRRCRDIATEVDEEITMWTREVAADLGLAQTPRPPPVAVPTFTDPPVESGRLETQLMTVLGVGFGLGVALLVSRLFAGLAPQSTVAGLVAGGVVGLAITVWVVRSRWLLHERAVLDRWVNDVTGAVRAAVEERVATRVLAAEAVLSSAYVVRIDTQRRAVDQRIAAVDAELRERACKIARAESARELEMPPLLRALQAVGEALADGNSKLDSTQSVVTGR